MTDIPLRQLPDLRRRVGLTQQQLAVRVGAHRVSIAQFEAALRDGGLADRMLAELTQEAALLAIAAGVAEGR